ERLAGHAPGDSVEFIVRRLGEPRRLTVTLGSREVPVYRLTEVEEPSDAQLAVRRLWRQDG
ncbi:MAG TPA: hypothetical protein VLC48_10380, partial [Gemmatimonadota bacterium]|nr:hypothetical protein [Gemmatimonadota bacterium]